MAYDDRNPDDLARRMCEEGIPPDRDLLPGINAAIDREEARRSVRPGDRAVPWPRLLAVAASLTVVLVAAWSGVHRDEGDLGPDGAPQVAVLAEPAGDGGMDVIDRALDELNEALTLDPDNRNLSRLVLMVYQKRGALLRKNDGTGYLP